MIATRSPRPTPSTASPARQRATSSPSSRIGGPLPLARPATSAVCRTLRVLRERVLEQSGERFEFRNLSHRRLQQEASDARRATDVPDRTCTAPRDPQLGAPSIGTGPIDGNEFRAPCQPARNCPTRAMPRKPIEPRIAPPAARCRASVPEICLRECLALHGQDRDLLANPGHARYLRRAHPIAGTTRPRQEFRTCVKP